MKISHPRVWLGLGCIAGLLELAVPSAQAQNLADTIEKIKPSIVAIGTFQKTRRPPSIFRGTGFIVADGLKGEPVAGPQQQDDDPDHRNGEGEEHPIDQ